jgi:hypothetical protein
MQYGIPAAAPRQTPRVSGSWCAKWSRRGYRVRSDVHSLLSGALRHRVRQRTLKA